MFSFSLSITISSSHLRYLISPFLSSLGQLFSGLEGGGPEITL